MPAVRRISLALKSLHALVDALDKLPESKERAAVLAGVHECKEAVERWHQQPPGFAENEQVMGRILKLHVAATWLRRR
jgi:hypothetical protein